MDNKETLISYYEPSSSVSESIRSLYTNIRFLNVNKKCQAITVTSSIPGDGKTFIAANLAAITAASNKKTLIIDCDMRRSMIAQTFGIKTKEGLSDLLLNKDLRLADISFNKTEINNLFAITNVISPPNPAELLEGQAMDKLMAFARQEFEVIYLDTPPILSVTDALIVGQKTDGIILVATLNQTPKPSLERACDIFKGAGINIFGTVLNKDNVSLHHKYSHYYTRK
jgi:capsular exopolysaccharide synthesis family protein